MPIVFIHGVATRAEAPDAAITALMQRYLADVVAPARELAIEFAYWGDVGVEFAWDGAARPRTPLLGMGAANEGGTTARAILAAELSAAFTGLPEANLPSPAASDLVPAGPQNAPTAATPRLKDFTAEQLSDVLAAVVAEDAEPDRRAGMLIAADEVAHDPQTLAKLAGRPDLDAECVTLAAAIEQRAPADLVGQGVGLGRLGDRVREAVGRSVALPGVVASRMVAEFREPINRLATLFVGDVFAYLERRGTVGEVGEIPLRFLEALRRARDAAPAGEPLVVVSHSMGGQIVYDAVTTFLPEVAEYRDLRVDFWCATASQVGLFEEMKMFLASSPAYRTGRKVPFPNRKYLGGWWNVWDHNDFISYTGAPIFEGIDDEAFDTGMTLVGAHSGYLLRPSFYRRLADKLQKAADAGWYR